MGDELQGGAVSAGRSAVRASSLRANRRFALAVLGVVVAAGTLGACALPQGITPPTATAYDFQGADFRTLMYSAATDYAAAQSFGDTGHVNNTIASCYRQYDQSSQYQNTLGAGNVQGQLRRCIEIDYLAYKDNQALTSRGLAGNPYLTMDALEQRWGRYGPLAGFQDPNKLFEYARAGYAVAKPVEVNAMRNRQGIQMPALHQATGTFGF